MDFKLIIFDLDGTLVDTLPDIHNCVLMTLKKMGLPPVPLETTKRAIGPNHETFARIVMGGGEEKEIIEFFRIFRPIYMEKNAEQTRPFPGMTELLDSLGGYDMAVASNKVLAQTQSILEKLNLIDRFKLVVGPELVSQPKPAPDMIDFCADHFGIDSSQILVVGDTDNDIEAAQRAGAKSCFARWGYAINETELETKADFSISHPLELLKLVPLKVKAEASE